MAFHVQLCLLRNTYEPIPAIPTQFIGPRCVICYLIHRKKKEHLGWKKFHFYNCTQTALSFTLVNCHGIFNTVFDKDCS